MMWILSTIVFMVGIVSMECLNSLTKYAIVFVTKNPSGTLEIIVQLLFLIIPVSDTFRGITTTFVVVVEIV